MDSHEINKRIAIEVMGWFQDGKWWKQILALQKKSNVTVSRYEVEYWNPAERIDHAWMVVEKHSFYAVCKVEDHYFVVFDMIKGPRADTAPMAICLAALATKEEK